MTNRRTWWIGMLIGAGLYAATCLAPALLVRGQAISDNPLRYSQSEPVAVLSAAYRIAIPNTSRLICGADPNLSVVGGPTSFPDGTLRIGLVIDANTAASTYCHFNLGVAATVAGPQWPATTMTSVGMTPAMASAMRVISSNGTIYGTLLVYTARN